MGKKYGFADIEDISSKERLASYITKYITKEITDYSIEEGAKKRYMASRNLDRPRKVYDEDKITQMMALDLDTEPVNRYENEHISISTYRRKNL